MGTTDNSTKMSQLSPPKSDRPRIAGTRFTLAFDQHIGFHTGFTWGFRSQVMQAWVWFLIWAPMWKLYPWPWCFGFWWYHNLFGGCIGSNLILGYCLEWQVRKHQPEILLVFYYLSCTCLHIQYIIFMQWLWCCGNFGYAYSEIPLLFSYISCTATYMYCILFSSAPTAYFLWFFHFPRSHDCGKVMWPC